MNTEPYRDKRDGNVALGFLLPSYASDISVTLLEGELLSRENAAAAYAGGLFLREARGLPLDEISVETSSKIYNLQMSDPCGRLGIILPKCKVMYSNKPVNVDGVELLVSAFTCGDRIYRICECEDSDTFAESSLRALTQTYGTECIDGACAFSPSGEGYAVKLHAVKRGDSDILWAALAVATGISRTRAADVIRLSLCGVDVSFQETAGGFCTVDESARIYLLSAPDFS